MIPLIYLKKPKKGLVVDPPTPRDAFVPSHPWQMDVIFYDGKWHLSIEAGFINGVDPRFPRAEEAWLAAQNTDEGTSNPVYNNGGGLVSGREIGLLDADPAPILDTDWKDILEQPPSYPRDVIPEYFAKLYGIKPPPNLDTLGQSALADVANNTNSVINTLSDYTDPSYQLYKCDVWIEQARTTYSVAVDVPGNLVTGDLVDYTVMIDSSTLKSGLRPKVSLGPVIPTRTFVDGIQYNPAYIDSKGNNLGIDFLQIGTLYWLSPDTTQNRVNDPNDTDQKGKPTWTPFVRHDLFYNLSYYKKNAIPFNLKPLGLDPFLAFFVGQYTFAAASTLGVMNSIEQQLINNISNQVDQSGMFWTT